MATHRFEDRIEVFGSNERGRHGKGHALQCARFFGAEEGVGEGMTGQCYAIPTKDHAIQTRPLSAIEGSWERFIETAAQHQDKRFYVARVGCGLAGYSDDEMLSIVRRYNLPPNVILPGIWRFDLKLDNTFPIIIAGGRDFDNFDLLSQTLDHQVSRALAQGLQPVCVSGRARGADQLGEQWAQIRGYEIEYFPAPWDAFKARGLNVKAAGMVRNAMMAQYATALSAFWDGTSRGTKGMLDLATSFGLKTRVTHYTVEHTLNNRS